MKNQQFKLSDIQINYLELFDDSKGLSYKNFDFDTNTVSLNNDELEYIFEQITKYHSDDLLIFNDILDTFIKQDRNNVIKEYVPCGIIETII